MKALLLLLGLLCAGVSFAQVRPASEAETALFSKSAERKVKSGTPFKLSKLRMAPDLNLEKVFDVCGQIDAQGDSRLFYGVYAAEADNGKPVAEIIMIADPSGKVAESLCQAAGLLEPSAASR